MIGLILAAGSGTRMEVMDTPKCLMNLGSVPIIEYQYNVSKNLGLMT